MNCIQQRSRTETVLRRLRRSVSRRGAAVVELAILLPLLIFLFVVAVDFARIFYFSVTLTDCARAGAMYASDPTVSGESAFASAEAAALADATNLSPPPSITTSNGVDGAGRPYVEVTAAYLYLSDDYWLSWHSQPGQPHAESADECVRQFS